MTCAVGVPSATLMQPQVKEGGLSPFALPGSCKLPPLKVGVVDFSRQTFLLALYSNFLL